MDRVAQQAFQTESNEGPKQQSHDRTRMVFEADQEVVLLPSAAGRELRATTLDTLRLQVIEHGLEAWTERAEHARQHRALNSRSRIRARGARTAGPGQDTPDDRVQRVATCRCQGRLKRRAQGFSTLA